MDESDESAQLPPKVGPKVGPNVGSDVFDESSATVLSPNSKLKATELPAGMTPRELAHALQGELLDQFHLQQFVGGGGMGVVFKARDTTLDRIVAVKVIASHTLSTEVLQKRFLVEAQSAARLDHPNIARVYDSGRSRGLPYIVFEFIEGANVRDLVLNHGPLPLGDALSYTYQIAHALTHASQRDVIHRDIKPSNILVTRDGQAKLVDMGLARFYQVDSSEEELTNTGVTLGTFDYISPEQARDPRVADTRSDIYSLGCTLFYMLAGHPPFSQASPAQKLLKHQGELPPELLDLRSDLPEAVAKLVQWLLAKQPEDRPQTPTELVGALADLLQTEGLRLPQSLAPPAAVPVFQTPQVWRHLLPWALPIAALLVISSWLNSIDSPMQNEERWPEFQTINTATAIEESVVDQADSTSVAVPTKSVELADSENLSEEPGAPAEPVTTPDQSVDSNDKTEENRVSTAPEADSPEVEVSSPEETTSPIEKTETSARNDVPTEGN